MCGCYDNCATNNWLYSISIVVTVVKTRINAGWGEGGREQKQVGSCCLSLRVVAISRLSGGGDEWQWPFMGKEPPQTGPPEFVKQKWATQVKQAAIRHERHHTPPCRVCAAAQESVGASCRCWAGGDLCENPLTWAVHSTTHSCLLQLVFTTGQEIYMSHLLSSHFLFFYFFIFCFFLVVITISYSWCHADLASWNVCGYMRVEIVCVPDVPQC